MWRQSLCPPGQESRHPEILEMGLEISQTLSVLVSHSLNNFKAIYKCSLDPRKFVSTINRMRVALIKWSPRLI